MPGKAERPVGVSEQTWADFQSLRRSKKAPLTVTAMTGIEREALKAGMPVAEVIELMCQRGWAGFKAEWLRDQRGRGQANSRPPTRGEIFADQLRNGPARADDGRTIDVQATVADERPAPPHLALIRAGRF